MFTEAILDSSVIVAAVTVEKYSDWAMGSMQAYEYFHILDLSFYEVANALKNKVSKLFTAEDAAAAFGQAQKMMNLCEVHTFSEVAINALNEALALNITAYDAAFPLLAEKLGIRLLSIDLKLARKLESTKYKDLIDYPNR